MLYDFSGFFSVCLSAIVYLLLYHILCAFGFVLCHISLCYISLPLFFRPSVPSFFPFSVSMFGGLVAYVYI